MINGSKNSPYENSTLEVSLIPGTTGLRVSILHDGKELEIRLAPGGAQELMRIVGALPYGRMNLNG